MTDSSVTLTRKELYDLVWSEPMRTLAQRYDISDVGLKKICTKHRIPVPRQGHWQRVQAGRAPARIPLPTVAIEPRIVLSPKPAQQENAASSLVTDPQVAMEQSQPPVVVAETLDHPHPLTRQMRQELKRQKPDEYGAIRCFEPDALPLRIHPSSTERVLRIADALLKASVSRSFDLRPGKRGARFGGGLQILVDGEPFEIAIEERMRRESHKPMEQEQSRRRRGLYVYSRSYDFVPTGELTLKIEPCYGSGLQSTWRDTRHQKIEARLGEVMLSLRRHAALRKAEREKAQRKAERFEQDQRRRAELRTRVEAERRAVAKLEQDAESWQRAERIRAYVAAVERSQKDPVDPEHASWVEWARATADRIDPTADAPASILDTPESEMQPIALWQFSDPEAD